MESKKKKKRSRKKKMVQWKWQEKKVTIDWSNLEPDLLELITTRLQIKDIARMKSMCKAWCSVIEERDILAHNSKQQQQLPWLLFPGGRYNSRVCRFYSLMDNSTSRFRLSDHVTGPNPRVYGSSYGWLVIRDRYAYPSFLVLNPLTRKHTTLPPVFPQHVHSYELCKVILSDDPSRNSDWIAVAMYGPCRALAIAKPGDLEWTSVHQANPFNDDMVIWKDNIYVIQPCYLTGSLRINLGVCSLKLPKLETESFELELPHNYPHRCISYNYLVVSSSGDDLLLVCRILENLKYVRTRSFLVYKLEIEEEGTVWKWKKIETLLENEIIFLGINSPICLPASYAADQNCEPNCIYFADGNRGYRVDRHEVVVFDMVSRQLRHLSGYHPSTWPLTPPVWFTPSLC